MKIESHKINDILKVKLIIKDVDLVKTRFDKSDRAFLEKCNASNKISDMLLGLEMITRRIEESK